jgi:hypothetical protein
MVVGHLPAVRDDPQVNSTYSYSESASSPGFCTIPDAFSSEMLGELPEFVGKIILVLTAKAVKEAWRNPTGIS